MTISRDTPVVIFGAGGHCKVVIAALRQLGFQIDAICDDDEKKWGNSIHGVPVVGIDSLAIPDAVSVIAIGDNRVRQRLAQQYPDRRWCKVIHPSAQVHSSARVGPGVFIGAGAIVQPDAVLGAHAIINTGATVDHDCTIEDFAHVAPGVNLAGGVRVGRGTLLGVGSAVIPNVRIGSWSIVGGGSVVTHDLPDGVTAVGVPAQVKKTHGKNGRSVAAADSVHGNGAGKLHTRQEKPVFAPWPSFEEDEIEAAAAVLRSGKVNYWTGKEGHQFESEFAAFTGSDHAIALANGTLALELALYTLGIGPGDEVIVPSRTFIASASCVVARGAKPVMADVDPNSQNITAETARQVLSPKTKAIIAVHLAGWPCEMDSIMDLARQLGLKVVEDCAQALGARYRGKMVGSIGDVGAFSFCQDKIMTTGGEGGMLTTNSEEIWDLAWSYKDHGKSWDAVYEREHSGIFKWLHESFGSNYRMTEMQSAIGRVALRKVPQWVESRRKNALFLQELFSELPAMRLTPSPAHIYHSYYKYYAFLHLDQLSNGWDRDGIVRSLQEAGIPCGMGSCSEIYQEVAFQRNALAPAARLPIARSLGDSSLMFQVHPTLSLAAIRATGEAVRDVVRQATQVVAKTKLVGR